MRPHFAKGFTLVEILIVVAILGILAALVVPKFTDASENAKGGNLVSSLQAARTQLQVYQAQHAGKFPTLAQMWGNLTSKTDVTGALGAGATFKYGPYLKAAPTNPLENSSTVAAAAAAGVGWVYNAANGQITACLSTAKMTALKLSATDVTAY